MKVVHHAISVLFGLLSVSEAAVWINEIHYDNSRGDFGEFVEVGCNADTDLSGYTIVRYNGNGGTSYGTDTLTGTCSATKNQFVVVDYSSNGLQNGSSDGIALVDVDKSAVQFLSYEGTLTATNGPAAGLTSTDIGVRQSSATVGTSLQLTGTGCESVDFTWSEGESQTKGVVNVGQVFSCDLDTCTSIQNIQGTGLSSPLEGQDVDICGAYVTAVVHNGFFLQEIVSNSSGASSGIFVYDTSSFKDNIQTGDEINVSGSVQEEFGHTQITMSSATVKSGMHVFDPVVITLPAAGTMDFEALEGMLVSVVPSDTTNLVVSEYYNFERYGEVVVCAVDKAIGRAFQFTENNAPDTTLYRQDQEIFARTCIKIDDNSSSQNPNPVLFGAVYQIDSSNYLRGGSRVTTLKGPLWYSFGNWRVATLSTNDLSYENNNPRASVPQVTGDLKIVNSNLLNYFVTLTQNSSKARGADDKAEFDRQVNKAILALMTMNADIVCVQELENVAGNRAAYDLVDRMNTALPGRNYTFASIEAGFDTIGTDVVKVDVMFDQNVVMFLNAAFLTDDDVDQALLDKSTTGAIFNGSSRVPLAASFSVVEGSNVLTTVVNHFKSKGDRTGRAIGADDDQNDGAGNYNLMRVLSSQALLQWVSSDPTGVATDNIMLVGDFNAYSAEPPITEILNNGYSTLKNVGDYSYNRNGRYGKLDHAFINQGSTMQVQSAVWNCNSDELSYIDYNLDYGRDSSIFDPTIPERFSDHDPIIMGVTFSSNSNTPVSAEL
eukprot:CAMPEP_0203663238 /NCGR_PEP_ID=MMETSP0090-20130426/899_1 /ASSEMBLY_ACC=CAM_ASM_001088 /TAXON_ID=426623 /ORGANISM="Chaetoceros affinis, Strain CCMP159" /LENGTH=773 /DNA_ID=CAMNT_0050526121 /DNA_START=15 /DNA_END=2336 /DNA_ORIENTATION=+